MVYEFVNSEVRPVAHGLEQESAHPEGLIERMNQFASFGRANLEGLQLRHARLQAGALADVQAVGGSTEFDVGRHFRRTSLMIMSQDTNEFQRAVIARPLAERADGRKGSA